MNEEQDLKLTDLDYLIGDHHLQMMKAALPYVNVPEQKMISLFVKVNELHRTIDLFRDGEVATMGICSMEKQSATPMDMLNAIKPYGNTYEQDFIDLVSNFLQGSNLYNSYQNTVSKEGEKGTESSGGLGGMFGKNPMDLLMNILPQEQQSKFETVQMLMQVMQGST